MANVSDAGPKVLAVPQLRVRHDRQEVAPPHSAERAAELVKLAEELEG